MDHYSALSLLAAGAVALLTTFVTFKAAKGNEILGNPIVSLCVGGLTFAGLLQLAGDWQSIVLLPYAAVGIAVLTILLLMALKSCSPRGYVGKDKGTGLSSDQRGEISGKEKEDALFCGDGGVSKNRHHE